MNNKLKIYNQLRVLHKKLFDIKEEKLDNFEKMSLENISNAFYLAENIFANSEK